VKFISEEDKQDSKTVPLDDADVTTGSKESTNPVTEAEKNTKSAETTAEEGSVEKEDKKNTHSSKVEDKVAQEETQVTPPAPADEPSTPETPVGSTSKQIPVKHVQLHFELFYWYLISSSP
jgi:hypothetical protein